MNASNSDSSTAGARLAVLGGCGGIGRALVATALERGLRVAVLDLEASLHRYPVAPGVLALPVDATDDNSLSRAFDSIDQQWGALDGFVNLCGYMHDNQPSASMPKATWADSISGNLNTTFSAASAALPLLRKGNGASMVHAASGLAQNIRPGFGAYAAAKAGVIALTKTLALENAPDVRVNAVAPSAVDTAFLRGGTGRSDEQGEPNIDIEAYTRAIPLQRIAVPMDVVGPIMFLLDEASSYMSGQVLWINGGSYMP